MSASKLKTLQVQRNRLLSEIEKAEHQRDELSKKLGELNSQLEATDSEIEELKSAAPIITEHALLRYVERVMQIDLEEVKNKILASGSVVMAGDFPNGKFEIGDGFVAVVRDRTIVTIEPKSKPKKCPKDKTWLERMSEDSVQELVHD